MQPLITSLMQPYVVLDQESFRESCAATFNRAGNVPRDKLTTEINRQANRVASELSSSSRTIDTQLRSLLRAHALGYCPANRIPRASSR
jgi:hypothetical protein